MRTRSMRVTAWGVIALFSLVSVAMIWGQEESTESPQEITIAPHWSPYQAPTSYPEGTQLHIIVKGDTLWDLANQYFTNPFLWPHLWNANRYITNPHWIYPGDPLVIPQLEVVREAEPGVPGAPGEPVPGEPGYPGVPGVPGVPMGPNLIPAFEEISIQCAGYVNDKEDESLKVIGSEEGGDLKVGMATGDIVYINGGTSDGISPGDVFYLQRRVQKVQGGWQIERSGWATVLAAQDRTAIAEITQACIDVNLGDYLIPFEQVPVPLVPVQQPATRLTPETGKLRGQIIASLNGPITLGQGHLVGINLGERDGVIPGNIFTIFRYLLNDVQRKMLGELVVLTVQEKAATAKITYSHDFILEGDLVELK